MRKYNKIFYNKGIKYSKQKQIETKIFLIASLDIHKLQRNLLVASKTGSVTCGEPEQRAVAIAQKTVIVLQGVLVEITPPLADTCCYQQKQRALGLVEVGDDRLGIMKPVAGNDHDLGMGNQLIGTVPVEIIDNRFQSKLR